MFKSKKKKIILLKKERKVRGNFRVYCACAMNPQRDYFSRTKVFFLLLLKKKTEVIGNSRFERLRGKRRKRASIDMRERTNIDKNKNNKNNEKWK